MTEKTCYTETELCSIATLALKLIVADSKISPKELVSRTLMFRELDITPSHEQTLPSFNQACQIYRDMDVEKQDEVKDFLHQLALSDGIIVEKEKLFIDNLDKS